MLTLGFVIVIFAGFVRAGSSTNASLSERGQIRAASVKAYDTALVSGRSGRGSSPRSESDEVAYWHDLAVKRLKLVGKREHRIVVLLHKLRAGHSVGSRGPEPVRPSASIRNIICQVFGSQCSKALSVAWCESRFNIYARNGQYLGLFQMGEYARARYGHAWDAWTQARAAHRYYLDAGWSPWSCA